jgi:hypothetical protein
MSGQSVSPFATAVTPPPPLKIPDVFTEATLATELGQRLTGRSADTGAAVTSRHIAGQVIWLDAGSEVMVHLDSTKTHIGDGQLLVSVDFECDQTGRTPLIAAFGMNRGSDAAGLFCTTDALPRGNGLLAARWGRIYQDALWAALTSLIADHAAERKLFPLALICANSTLRLASGPPLNARQLAVASPNLPPGGTR